MNCRSKEIHRLTSLRRCGIALVFARNIVFRATGYDQVTNFPQHAKPSTVVAVGAKRALRLEIKRNDLL